MVDETKGQQSDDKAAPKKKAPKKKAATKSGKAKYRQLVRCHVKRVSAFNVSGTSFAEVFTDLKLTRGSHKTYYAVDETHVMPLGHALDLVSGRVVPKASIARLPDDSDEKPSGIVKRIGEAPPKAAKKTVKPSDFEDGAIDIDNLPVAGENDDEDWG